MNDEELEGVFDYGLASDNTNKIKYFLEKINSIAFENPKSWEKELLEFFREEVIVPYVISTSIVDNSDELMESTKKVFLDEIINKKTVHLDTNDCYRELIKIRNSLKAGVDLKTYLPYLFKLNFFIRRMFLKVIDEDDSNFKKYGVGITPVFCELKNQEKGTIVGYETTLFVCPDNTIDYPLDEWTKKISSSWRQRLESSFKKKTTNKRTPLDTKLRHEVFKRDNYKCKECGATKEEKVLHADHINPKSQGGLDELCNLQTLCQDCNLAKSDKHWIGGENGINN